MKLEHICDQSIEARIVSRAGSTKVANREWSRFYPDWSFLRHKMPPEPLLMRLRTRNDRTATTEAVASASD